MADALVQRIGPYRLIRELGRGGMGVVHLARDERLGRPVAIKTLSPEAVEDGRQLSRLRREARLLAQLSHPNLAQVYDLVEQDGRLFIVLEFIEGRRLDEAIDDGLDLERAIDLLTQILRGLEAAHERGIIHRDLKPQNIHVTSGGLAKVLDFGLARSVAPRRGSPAGSTTVTRPGAVAGTPGYMSPEQCRGDALDERTDIWAFGCIAFECLTGRAAFDGDDETCRIERSVEGQPQWEVMPAEVPQAVRRLLERCLEKDPKKRAGSCREVRAGLERAMEEAESHALAGNLRPDLTSFIGREQLLAEVEQLVSRHRLVTLTGAGGCGKSRLARQTALNLWPAFPQGAWLVELAPLRRDAEVERAVLATLEPQRGVSLAEALGHRRMLLVLDNCEHLLRGCRDLVERILHTSDRVHVLATGREAIGLFGEQVVSVPPLELGPVAGGISEASQLFMARAHLAEPRFTPTPEDSARIERICASLDGIPLAVELAAACVRAVPIDELAHRLHERLDALPGKGAGRPAHQQTLERTIAWSDGLLSPAERALLRRMSVFRGGWTFEACQEVCADSAPRRFARRSRALPKEDLTSLVVKLVDKSLVVFDGERRRYRMLETIRRYASEHLDRRLRDDLLDRHMRFFLQKAERAAEGLQGRGRADWLDRLDRDLDNLRLAIETSRTKEPELELRLGTALCTFWSIRGHSAEGLEVLDHALARNKESPAARRAEAEHAAGMLAWRCGRLDAATSHYLRSLRLWRQMENERRVPSAVANLGMVCSEKRDFQRARRLLARASDRFDRLGEATAAAQTRQMLAVALLEQDRLEEAEDILRLCIPVFQQDTDEQREAVALTNLGEVLVRAGRSGEAIEPLERARGMREALGDERGLARVLVWLASAREGFGQKGEAARVLEAADRIRAARGIHLSERDEKARRATVEAVGKEALGKSGRIEPGTEVG